MPTPAEVPAVSVPAGEPGVLQQSAGRCAAAADRLSGLGKQLSGSAAAVADGRSWCGAGSTAYLAAVDEAVVWYGNASAAMGKAATALATYAAELTQAQDVARAARAAAVELSAAREAHTAEVAALPATSVGTEVVDGTVARLAAASESITAGASRVASLAGNAEQMAQAAATKAAAAFDDVTAMTSANRVRAAQSRIVREQQEAAEQDRGWFSSIGHTVLDVVGLVPVLGEPADGINAVWYEAEGDHLNAGLSAAGMIPFAGWFATGGKLGKRGLDAVEAGADLAAKQADEAAAGLARGSEGLVGGLGAASSPARQAALEGAETSARQKPDWLVRVQEGQQFNRDNWHRYSHNEVRLSNNKVLDSYNPQQEIVFRRHTQASEVQVSTFKSYLSEFKSKYFVDETITVADVPKAYRDGYDELVGEPLQGRYIFEVPVQAKPVPEELITSLDELQITLRDVEGTVYN